MNLIQYESLPSTQQHLISMLKNGNISQDTCIIATNQHSGIGSRGNQWDSVERGLYCSFCKRRSTLPMDLHLQSMSIFFGFIFKETLSNLSSKVWLKYPNDLYINDNKIGGIICNIIDSVVVCGIGVNLFSSKFAHLDINIDIVSLLNQYFIDIDAYTWSDVFVRYKKEFYKNNDFSFHHKEKIISFNNAILLDDGAILVDSEVIYSAR